MSIGCAVVTGVPRPGLAAQCVWGALPGYLMWCNTGTVSVDILGFMADNPRRRGRSRPESPRVFGGRWQVVKELGSGGPGTAFLVRDVNGENADAQYVLKQLRIRRPGERHEWQQKRLDRFEREIAALRRLDLSPNIPSVVDSYVGSKVVQRARTSSRRTPARISRRCATSSSRKQYCNSSGGLSRLRSSPTTEKLCTAT